MWQALTEPPEEAAGEADGKEQPDLVKALLGSRQETALQQLLEKFLAAEGGHRSPSRMGGQMDRPVKVGTQSRDVHGADHAQGIGLSADFSWGLSNPSRHTELGGLGEGVGVRYIRLSRQLCVWERPGCTHTAHDLW